MITSWTLRAIAAVILLQTLFFKFTGARESVYIFSTLGMEPWGRIGSGVAELIASILLLIPSTAAFGALMSLGVISGAIFFHLFTPLGVAVQVAVLPLVYWPLRAAWPDTFNDDKVQQRARDLWQHAHGAGLLLLILVVVIGAPDEDQQQQT